MDELLRDAIRWVERDGKLVLQTKCYIFHPDGSAGQGWHEIIWDDVRIEKDEDCVKSA